MKFLNHTEHVLASRSKAHLLKLKRLRRNQPTKLRHLNSNAMADLQAPKSSSRTFDGLLIEVLTLIAKHCDMVSAAMLSISSKILYQKLGKSYTQVFAKLPPYMCRTSLHIMQATRRAFLVRLSRDLAEKLCDKCNILHKNSTQAGPYSLIHNKIRRPFHSRHTPTPNSTPSYSQDNNGFYQQTFKSNSSNSRNPNASIEKACCRCGEYDRTAEERENGFVDSDACRCGSLRYWSQISSIEVERGLVATERLRKIENGTVSYLDLHPVVWQERVINYRVDGKIKASRELKEGHTCFCDGLVVCTNGQPNYDMLYTNYQFSG